MKTIEEIHKQLVALVIYSGLEIMVIMVITGTRVNFLETDLNENKDSVTNRFLRRGMLMGERG